jgi:hypothetical protein
MDLASLRAVIRSMVRDQPDQITSSIPWHTTDTFRQLSPTQQTSVRALARAPVYPR